MTVSLWFTDAGIMDAIVLERLAGLADGASPDRQLDTAPSTQARRQLLNAR
jgi:hypothetical protein